MSQEDLDFLECKEEDYKKVFAKEEFPEVESLLKEKAIKDGFELKRPTGIKKNSIYFVCGRAGKFEKQGDGKRSTSSKKIGINYLE